MNQRVNQQNGDTGDFIPATRRLDIHTIFAACFRNWRLKNNLTLKEVAADLGISISTVNSWELGQRFPTGRHFEMLLDYTGLLPCQLFCPPPQKCNSTECEFVLMTRKAEQPAVPPRVSTLSRI